MPRKPAPTKLIRTTVPVATEQRLQRLAEALGTTAPNLLRFMISAQLVQWEAMYLHPDRFMAAAEKAGAGAAELADQFAEEAEELATGGRAGGDRPGFRPGGKPRSFHELQEVATLPGGEWSGYLRGL